MASFKQFDFVVLQLRFVKAAMDELPSFLPDGKTAAEVQTMRDDAEAVKVDYQTADTAVALARGALEEARQAAHLLCIQIYPILKSRYRKDVGSLQAILRLPVDDRTARATRERMKATSLLWTQLPNPPGDAVPFTPWTGMNQAAFDAVLADLVAKDEGLPAVIQDYEHAQAELHVQMAAIADFVTAALVQGRAQFPEGTLEREIIDAIPMEPAQQTPAQATIQLAISPAAGQARIDYDAAHATMFDIWMKGPGDADFVEVMTDSIQRTHTVTGLADGQYEFRVAGQNSLGNGPLSDPAAVLVSSGGGGGNGPPSPGAPTLTATNFDALHATWATVAGAITYRVFRMVVGTDLDFVELGTVATNQATLSPMPPGETVRVRLTAINANGESAPGPYAEIVMPDAP